MSGRRGAVLIAWGWCVLVLALIVCAVVLAVFNRYGLGMMSFLFAEVSAALVGGLISSREPRNPIGWFILGHVFCFSLGEFARQYAIYGVFTAPGSLPFARAAIWPTYWIWYLGLLLMVALLPLYFPNGRLVSPRWRWAVRAVALFAVVAVGITMFLPGDGEAAGLPNPLGIEGFFEGPGLLSAALAVVLSASWPVLGATSTVSLVVRFRCAAGEERQQIKWVVYAVVFMVTYFALSQLFLRDLIPIAVDDLLLLVSLESLWIAFAVAILRYHLYDIDVLINRTLVYGAVTAVLAAVYFGTVIMLQYAFRAVIEGDSQLAVVASTLAIAALFNPLRQRVQAFVDRRFYRNKYDARQTLEDLGAKLRDETDLDALGEDIEAAVRKTMQPEHVSL